MDYFNLLARRLLDVIPDGGLDLETDTEIIIHEFNDGRIFKLIYKGYNGRMAIPTKIKDNCSQTYKNMYWEDYNRRRNLGYYDFVVDTSNRYSQNPVTHKTLFRDLVNLNIQDKCQLIWRGESPFEITNDENEQQALLTLSLLMFEQEVNWGNNSFQKYTNFLPEDNARPRDMIMGMLNQAFHYGIEGVWHWTGERADFGGSYKTYDEDRKELFFKQLAQNSQATDTAREAKPLMIGEILENFKFKVANKRQNEQVLNVLSTIR